MIQVKIEVSAGGWNIELDRSAYSIQTASGDPSDAEQAREVLRELYREVDGLLSGRTPAGPPKGQAP